MKKVRVTMLSAMAGMDFEYALDMHVSWNIELVDLKDSIFGKNLMELTLDEAGHAADLIRERGLSVYCLSTMLFHGEAEMGETAFREENIHKVDHVINLAKILKPKLVRLLASQTSKRAEVKNSVQYIAGHHPWLIPAYGEAVERIYESGFLVTIENETGSCIFSNPTEIIDFFEELNMPEKVSLTWDVQNLWQMGTFPTMEVYRKLRNTIGYYHLKGGQSEKGGVDLVWRSTLEDASWPVVEITRQVVADGVVDVICLNSSHGKAREGQDGNDMAKRDLDFIRSAIPGIV